VSAHQPEGSPPELHIREAIEQDVRDLFAELFAEQAPDDETRVAGFQPDLGFGREGVVIAPSTRNDDRDRTYVFMRWRWGGVHVPDPDRRGRRLPFVPTGNWVTVEGLTILEVTRGDLNVEEELITGPEHIYARRLVDWLSVYAQLGLVAEGRAVGMASTMVKPAREFFGSET
jgi:hypothetical protein